MSLILPEDEQALVEKLLIVHYPVIIDIIMTSWQKFGRIDPEISYPLEPRTRANVVHDHICHEIRHKFANIFGVSIMENLGFLILNFSNLVLVRFKLLDRRRRASNIQTKLQRDYDDQLELPGIPSKTIRVVIGYQLDYSSLQTKIKDILITRPIRKREPIWSFSILNDVRVSQLPLVSEEKTPVVETPVKKRVKARKLKDVGEINGSVG